MDTRSAPYSLRRAAVVAGLGIAGMTVLTLFADLVAFQALLVPGDPAASAEAVAAGEALLRAGVLSLVVVVLADVLVAWALYVFFEPVQPKLSLLAAWLRLVYAALLGVALVGPILLAHQGAEPVGLGAPALNAHALLLLEAFYDVWDVGLIILGVHLLVLGVLAYRAAYVPQFLGVLLLVAGVGYPVAGGAELLYPALDASLVQLAGVFELLFMVWLLARGGRRLPSAAAADREVAPAP